MTGQRTRERRWSGFGLVGVLLLAGCGTGSSLNAPVNAAQRAAIVRYAAHQVWRADGSSETTRHVGCAIDKLGASRRVNRLTVYTLTACVQCPAGGLAAYFPMAYYLAGDTVSAASLRTGWDDPAGGEAVKRVFPSSLQAQANDDVPPDVDRYTNIANRRAGC